jgi:putative ABC transport system permease protein
MNLFQLIFKQMRQRALSTWLTMLSVLLGVALAVAIMILRRESAALFGQSDFGFELIVGPPKGSPLQLVLNTVYHLDISPGNVPYALYEDMARRTPAPPGRTDYRQYVRLAVPFMVGDSYNGRRIVGTSPQMFGFTDEGKPAEGYDEHGRLLPGYQDPDTPERDRDPSKPLAATVFKLRKDAKYELAEGRSFAAKKFEAVLGSDTAEREHMHIGSTFRATHGFPGPNDTPDIHKPTWTVVGILKPTHTANDRVLFVPVISLYGIEEHEIGLFYQTLIKAGIDTSRLNPKTFPEIIQRAGMKMEEIPPAILQKFGQAQPATQPVSAPAPTGELLTSAAPASEPASAHAGEEEEPDAYHLDANGDIVPDLPKAQWEVSAILVKTRGSFQAEQLMYNFRVTNPEASAVNPAGVMREFFDTFLKGSTQLLLVISYLVTMVAAVAILVSIYNSVSARTREIAILRALGATRVRIVALICLEAAVVGALGALLGLLVGHLTGAVESIYFTATLGQGINWRAVDRWEVLYLVATALVAMIAGLVPALKAYRTDVATNLVAG